MSLADKFFQEKFANRTVRRWEGINLSYDENTFQRDKPLDYLTWICLELKEISSDPIVIELGAARQPMNHNKQDLNPHCCNDGHSTFFWVEEGFKTFSVDVTPDCPSFLGERANLENYIFCNKDGVKFLQEYSGKIDLLFLDAWDVTPSLPYAEKHLEAFIAAESKLSKKHLIAIDDTDVGSGGKGKLLIPVLLEKGYHLVVDGRVSIFKNY